MALNGVRSDAVDVTPGAPQGSVLMPLLFLIYVDDITCGIESTIKAFVTDCFIYRVIKNADDSNGQQSDLTKVEDWCAMWNMELMQRNVYMLGFPEKSAVMVAFIVQIMSP